jgi:hypothetical protein
MSTVLADMALPRRLIDHLHGVRLAEQPGGVLHLYITRLLAELTSRRGMRLKPLSSFGIFSRPREGLCRRRKAAPVFALKGCEPTIPLLRSSTGKEFLQPPQIISFEKSDLGRKPTVRSHHIHAEKRILSFPTWHRKMQSHGSFHSTTAWNHASKNLLRLIISRKTRSSGPSSTLWMLSIP